MRPISTATTFVAIDLDSQRSTVSKPVYLPVGGHLDLRAALLAATSLPQARHDSIPRVDELLWARVITLEGRKPLPEEPPDAVMAVINAGLLGCSIVSLVPHDLRVIEREDGLHISALPCHPGRAHEFHVPLRHSYSGDEN